MARGPDQPKKRKGVISPSRAEPLLARAQFRATGQRDGGLLCLRWHLVATSESTRCCCVLDALDALDGGAKSGVASPAPAPSDDGSQL